jgi:hypothetical protein
MMDEWVDDRWKAVDTQILAFSGTDFKHLALAPHEGCDAPEEPSCVSEGKEYMGADEAWRGGRAHPCSPSRRGSMVVRGPRRHPRFAELAKRNSDRWPRHSDTLCLSPRSNRALLRLPIASHSRCSGDTAGTAPLTARPALQVCSA